MHAREMRTRLWTLSPCLPPPARARAHPHAVSTPRLPHLRRSRRHAPHACARPALWTGERVHMWSSRDGDVFCDVGSGTGRLVFAAAAMYEHDTLSGARTRAAHAAGASCRWWQGLAALLSLHVYACCHAHPLPYACARIHIHTHMNVYVSMYEVRAVSVIGHTNCAPLLFARARSQDTVSAGGVTGHRDKLFTREEIFCLLHLVELFGCPAGCRQCCRCHGA